MLTHFRNKDMKMEKGVEVRVMKQDDENYSKIGKIEKMDGANVTVRFGRFRKKTYRARYLQTVKRIK